MELIDLIESSNPNVLDDMISDEVIMDINEYGRTHLSKFEYEVYKKLLGNTSYKDIAKELNKSYKQITSTIDRIRKKLRLKIRTIYA